MGLLCSFEIAGGFSKYLQLIAHQFSSRYLFSEKPVESSICSSLQRPLGWQEGSLKFFGSIREHYWYRLATLSEMAANIPPRFPSGEYTPFLEGSPRTSCPGSPSGASRKIPL